MQGELDLYGDIIAVFTSELEIGTVIDIQLATKEDERYPVTVIRQSTYEEFRSRKPTAKVYPFNYFYAVIAE